VAEIIAKVRQEGDAALLDYIRKFDAPTLSLDALRVTEEEIEAAYDGVNRDFMDTLAFAVDRIETFHEPDLEEDRMHTRADGAITGRIVRPVDSAGLYVPGGQGGQTPLISSVLMNGLPAGIAGVARRVMATPPDKNGKINPVLLVAANEIGIDEIYKMGSAWAVAALAYGTATIKPVDVIVGPGNQYVTEAKRQVSGRVRIDMIAGPSEVLIIADGSANPAYIAADMLAQAEHDPQALAMCIVTRGELAPKIVQELEAQVETLSRKEIARKSLADHGVILLAESLAEAIDLANQIGAEHLELQIDEPMSWLPKIRHAGAIFLGHHTPEAVGDYTAGPNHVLPTMGTARFSSSLGVETFLKKSSVIAYPRQALANDAEHISRLAALEGLQAHGRSTTIRLDES
jgi:histidinol dehydrogenase